MLWRKQSNAIKLDALGLGTKSYACVPSPSR